MWTELDPHEQTFPHAADGILQPRPSKPTHPRVSLNPTPTSINHGGGQQHRDRARTRVQRRPVNHGRHTTHINTPTQPTQSFNKHC
jgi:hypothetical protein